MLVTTYNDEKMNTICLPQKAEGKYDVKSLLDDEIKVAIIEAENDKWFLKCCFGVYVQQETLTETIQLKYGEVLELVDTEKNELMYILIEQEDSGYQSFEKYNICQDINIRIGRAENNDIVCDLPYISASHAVISYNNSVWSIQDCNSLNGIFVNRIKVQFINLKPGDCIYIMGLKIITGKDFIAVNSPFGKTKINCKYLKRMNAIPVEDRVIKITDDEPEYFTIAPRLLNQIEETEISVDMPTTAQKEERLPIGLAIGPSLTMGLASLSSGGLSVYTALSTGNSLLTAMPMLVMSVSMLTGAAVWPVVNRNYDKKKKKIAEETRQEKYLEYLNDIREKIKKINIEQKEKLAQNIITTENCINRIINRESNLWERLPVQDDFLAVCIGKGNIPMMIDIKYPEEKFKLEKDALKDALRVLKNEEKILYNVPIAFSLKENNRIGLLGKSIDTINFLNAILIQLVALHSYQDVKIMLIDRKNTELQMFKWVPHLWDNEKKERYFYTNRNEIKKFDEFWNYKIENSIEDNLYYIVVSTDRNISNASNMFHELLVNKDLPVSVITVFDELQYTPREIKSLIDITGKAGKVYQRSNTVENIEFEREYYPEIASKVITTNISNCFLRQNSGQSNLPDMVTFLEMYGVSKVEHLNVLERWKNNDPVVSLKAPIGYNEKSELFYMDLHEKAHGPHGLIAGMTGSGKSEFIITLVLSLAVNYHPDEVSFVLIDYKGGGLVSAFEDKKNGKVLPHIAGTITNLDGSSIKRALVSIESELKRREHIFKEAAINTESGTMDIYKYQELYRSGIVNKPVPHLMIISDEFAELKSQEPEFMDKLISTARIGRSLGVHLILATQKPSGVVNDQIWSNSKFKVCLKVQDRSDSMEVIKREDAAELVNTGRFYLQVGYNEFFAIGQSAWCGADYIPKEANEISVKEIIQIINNQGNIIKELKPHLSVEQKKNRKKELVEIVNYLCNTGKKENISASKLWLDPIADKIYLSDIEKKYETQIKDVKGLCFLIGEYDDPANQRQLPYILSFSENGNTLVYGNSESGKENLIMTVLYEAINKYDDSQLRIYAMDFGNENLKAAESAAIVSGVIYSYESERVNWLFRMLKNEIDNRKKAFADYGGNYENYLCKGKKDYPYILVFLNEYSSFMENFSELETDFMNILREGTKYGIYVLTTISTINDIRMRISALFKQSVAMQLNDNSEYSAIFSGIRNMYPASISGRGLMKNNSVYEFQTACFTENDEIEYLKQLCLKDKNKNKNIKNNVPYLPEKVTLQNIKSVENKNNFFVLGYSSNDISPLGIYMSRDFLFPVMAKEIGRLKPFLEEFLIVSKFYNKNVTVIDAEHLTDSADIGKHNQFEDYIVAMYQELVERNNEYADTRNKKIFDNKEEKIYVIIGFKKLYDSLNTDGKGKLEVILRYGKAMYKQHIVIAENADVFAQYDKSIWYQSQIYGQNGIWIGYGIETQKVFDVNTFRLQIKDDMSYSFGYYVHGDRLTEARFLYKEDIDDE